MNKTLILTFVLLFNVVSLRSYAFEYKIVSNMADSTLNGSEISLTNDSDWGSEDLGVIKQGVIVIKGESNRTFPATLRIQNTNPENKKNININLIIEPGTIVVDVNNRIPLSGGKLNEGMKECIDQVNHADNIQEGHKILGDVLKDNVGNGLGEFVLLNYGRQCSPYEWNETISLFDEDTRNLPAIDAITGRMERLLPVWEGQPFKDVSGKDINGESIKLSEYVGKGKYVVADLWASWCKPCIILAKEVLKPIYEKYKNNPNVQFLGVSFDDISKVIEINDIPWPLIMECDELRKTYQIESIPQVIIFGPDGTILRRHIGEFNIPEVLDEIVLDNIVD